LVIRSKVVSVSTLFRLVSAPRSQLKRCLDELETAGVFSRTDEGVIYSRRMVSDEKKRATNRQNGMNGGNPKLKKSDNRRVMPNEPDRITEAVKPSDKARVKSIENRTSSYVFPIDRLAKALRIDLAKLHRLPKFQTFPALMGHWVELGCDPDKDIWPTIERIAKGRADIASPRFFEQAILEARDLRLASQPSDRDRWETRVASFRSHKFWAPQWGPPPDEPGCQAPADLLTPA
jgi:hypothetical protein